MDKTRKIECKVCGMPINDSSLVRCPRCHTVLLKVIGCSGNCLSCRAKGGCEDK